MIEIKNVNKSFGDDQILFDINTTFEKGKVNLIIGQSGQGKSVLAKCMVGLHDVDSGAILYEGLDFIKMRSNQKSKLRQEIGMLFQGSALFDSMNVEENIGFPLTMFTKMSSGEIQKRVDFCLERVNLSGKNKLLPSECSGGMQKRIGIARAISMNPKYLFCDEPNSGLDPKTAIVIDGLIQDITREYKMTTIVITHDMNSVIEIGENVIFIYQGKRWWQGDRKSIITTDNPEITSFVYASEFMKEIRANIQNSRN
ncbi:MAG: ATP-binding cassette domain-containing protein [Crocinitomicaceae bacterium]|jgi:phospholipid/cholesterol/gamma-HCH transport system ATP-binding protein|tara:strand:- start:2604 stop:3371 length:768 start_codon:yes stop_codon:yes gene_type:complete